MYSHIKLHMIAMIIVLIGSLNWLIIGFGYSNTISYIFSKYDKFIYILIGISALYLLFNRDTYLPFLGWSAFPGHTLQVSSSDKANLSIRVPAYENAVKVVYWAANPGKKIINNPITAYTDTSNFGVSEVEQDGTAILYFQCPQQYKVCGHTLDKHIHYRSIMNDGMLSPVETVNIHC